MSSPFSLNYVLIWRFLFLIWNTSILAVHILSKDFFFSYAPSMLYSAIFCRTKFHYTQVFIRVWVNCQGFNYLEEDKYCVPFGHFFFIVYTADTFSEVLAVQCRTVDYLLFADPLTLEMVTQNKIAFCFRSCLRSLRGTWKALCIAVIDSLFLINIFWNESAMLTHSIHAGNWKWNATKCHYIFFRK